MNVLDWVWTVMLLSLSLMVLWTWVDLMRDRPHKCCCGQQSLARHLDAMHDPDHTVHTRSLCQPCREVI